MFNLKAKILDYMKNIGIAKRTNYTKMFFYFLFGLKSQFENFKITINTNCLVLSQYPGAEIKGLGGLIAQYPKNFEVLCLTNGSSMLKEYDPIESASIKKQQFQEVMKSARIKGFKVFDIDDRTLKNHYSTFKKIDISEVDYVFIPNVFDCNPDTIALLRHFKQLLGEKEHKKNLKIIMYESDFSLATFDYYVDITQIIETKKKMLKVYYPEDKFGALAENVVGINAFRSINLKSDYCEVFMSFDIDDFLQIPFI